MKPKDKIQYMYSHGIYWIGTCEWILFLLNIFGRVSFR